ncbi:MAG: helix-turn-helix domain-containing protein [Gammaproteobacteria bacterium]
MFAELAEGFDALAAERAGKILRRHIVDTKPMPSITPEEFVGLRLKLNLSRAVVARYLRISKRTLENLGTRPRPPNAQAALLIRLVENYPDTVERLATI